jgi:hypothetical protein
MTGDASSPIVSIEMASSKRGLFAARSMVLPQKAQKRPPFVLGAPQFMQEDIDRTLRPPS